MERWLVPRAGNPADAPRGDTDAHTWGNPAPPCGAECLRSQEDSWVRRPALRLGALRCLQAPLLSLGLEREGGPRFERLFPPRDCCPLRPPPGGSLSQGRGPSRKATAPVWNPAPGGLPGSSDREVSSCNEGEAGLMPGSGRSSGQGNGDPLQYS